MKILTFIPVWKRPEITKLCYDSLKRTILNAPKGFSFVVLIVASNDKDAELASESGFEVFRCENKPLGRKFNQGLEYGLGMGNWDYLMQINSDNVLSVDFWSSFKEYFQQRQTFFGVDRIYFYDSPTKQMREFQYGAGCGIRFIRRDVIEKAGFIEQGDNEVFQLWDNGIDSGLDNNSSRNIMHRTHIMQYMVRDKRSGRPVVVDIKSSENIHPFSEFRMAKNLNTAHREQAMRRFPELKVWDGRMVNQSI